MIKHCLYYSLSNYIYSIYQIKIEAPYILHLLGGHYFGYTKLKNEKVPNIIIRCNIVNYDNFERNAGIKILRKKNSRITDIINNLKYRDQLILSNCYYLPYDRINYKNNYDNHLLIIKEYNGKDNTFKVSDANYENQTISFADLETAYQNVINIEPMYLDFKYVKEVDLISQIKNIIRTNHQLFYDRDYQNLLKLKSEIKNMQNLDNIYYKIALLSLSKSIRGVHGPITIRKIIHYSFESLFKENYSGFYDELSKDWENLANKLLRLKADNITFEDVLDYYDYVMDKEMQANEKIQMIID